MGEEDRRGEGSREKKGSCGSEISRQEGKQDQSQLMFMDILVLMFFKIVLNNIMCNAVLCSTGKSDVLKLIFVCILDNIN